eukprot:14432218-Alexandrium_andersonii.AAC.1
MLDILPQTLPGRSPSQLAHRGQMTLSAARNLQNIGALLSRGGRWRRRALRDASGAQICMMGDS